MSHFQLQEEQRPLDCQFRYKVLKSISLFDNYNVDGNRKNIFCDAKKHNAIPLLQI